MCRGCNKVNRMEVERLEHFASGKDDRAPNHSTERISNYNYLLHRLIYLFINWKAFFNGKNVSSILHIDLVYYSIIKSVTIIRYDLARF